MSAPDESAGREPLSDEVAARLYGILRRLTERAITAPGRGAEMDPTEIVHEAFVKLNASLDLHEVDRPGFISLAASVIRSVLVDAACRRAAHKRGGSHRRVTLDESALSVAGQALDVLDLDQALVRLAALDERQARIVELRFFGGLTNGEVGQLLGMTARAVSDEWVAARAFLRRLLTEPGNRA